MLYFHVSGLIWIVLFGWVMTMSVAANLTLTCLMCSKRRKNLVYLSHLALFVVNLVEYSALTFELSLGIEHRFPYGQASCGVYQAVAKTAPIVQAWLVVALLYYTANNYCKPVATTPSSQNSNQLCR